MCANRACWTQPDRDVEFEVRDEDIRHADMPEEIFYRGCFDWEEVENGSVAICKL